ncbi:MAG: M20/M25/M40 family metallo-hydrolase [Bacillota bacterium]
MTDLWSSLTQEAAAHLAALVRIDTTNPPGREKAAADYVAAALAEAGIQAEVVEPAPERGSVIGRLRGSGEADPLLLLAHLDVVPAVASEWRHDPFGGVTVDGEIWGRGTLDCKHLAAIWLTLLCHFKREGRRLRRDLILAATADEEMGGTWASSGWLTTASTSLRPPGASTRAEAGRCPSRGNLTSPTRPPKKPSAGSS